MNTPTSNEIAAQAIALLERDAEHAKPAPFLTECSPFPVIARRYNVSLTTVYGWVADGMPSFKVGKMHLAHVPTTDAWLRAKLTGAEFVPVTDVPTARDAAKVPPPPARAQAKEADQSRSRGWLRSAMVGADPLPGGSAKPIIQGGY